MNNLHCRPEAGTKVRCISKKHSSSVNFDGIEIGEVYTVAEILVMGTLDGDQMTLDEVNHVMIRPIYKAQDFELYSSESLTDAYDRAMSIL